MNLEVVRVQLCNNISLNQGPALSYVLCFEKYSCHENHNILVFMFLLLFFFGLVFVSCVSKVVENGSHS